LQVRPESSRNNHIANQFNHLGYVVTSIILFHLALKHQINLLFSYRGKNLVFERSLRCLWRQFY